MTECFRCGDDDHLSYDCPNRTPPRSAPPAVWPPATAAPPTPIPPPPPPRRPDHEIADAGSWAETIRRDMGWHRDMEELERRNLAMRQVQESRLERLAFLK